MTASSVLRPHALDNRNFRSLLLLLAGVPIAAVYLWRGLIQPLLLGTYLGDLQESYMRGAARLASGADPYDLCRTVGCTEPTGPQYVMPPLLAWLLQPLVGLDGHVLAVGVVLVLNAAVAVFLWSTLRALQVDDFQVGALLVLLVISFEPVIGNIDEGQINLILLALSGLWFLGWMSERWWGGIALGAAIALKVIQAPLALLVVWRRQWRMLGAAVATGILLWLVAEPGYLFEYLSSVLPAVSQGTGLFENHSPGGTVTRLFEPDAFLGGVNGSPPPARLITLLISMAVLVVTLVVSRSSPRGREGRALQAAAFVAVTPLVATYSWGTHLVLLLLPMSVLCTWGLRRRDWTVLALVGAGWLLIGPAHKALQVLLVSGYSDLLVLRLMGEFGVVGLIAIWSASLLALNRKRRVAAVALPGSDRHARGEQLPRAIQEAADR